MSFTNTGNSNGVFYGKNVDFTGNSQPAETMVADGQLLIGSSVAPKIKVGTLTPGSGISILNASNSITISATGGVLTQTAIVTSAQLLTLGSTGPLLIFAPPANPNQSYQVLQVACYVPFRTTPYTDPGITFNLLWTSATVSGSPQLICSVQPTPLLTSSGNTFQPLSPAFAEFSYGVLLANSVNQGIYLDNTPSYPTVLTNGDSDLHIQITYILITTPF